MIDQQKLVDRLRMIIDGDEGDLDIIEQGIKDIFVIFYGDHIKDIPKFVGDCRLHVRNVDPVFESALRSLFIGTYGGKKS
jgi:hypothetical protein